MTGEIDAPTFGELSRACSLSRRIGAGAVVGNAAPGDPEVYVRGTVKHRDHATIRLDGWHRVELNTETQAAAMSRVAFLD